MLQKQILTDTLVCCRAWQQLICVGIPLYHWTLQKDIKYILFYGVLWASVETAVCDIYRNVESLQWVITMLA